MKKNLNNLPLFELFLDFGIGKDWIDIHNDFFCERVVVDELKKNTIIFEFIKTKIGVKYSRLYLCFVDYKIITFSSSWEENSEERKKCIFNPTNFIKYGHLDNLARCRFVDEFDKIIEIDNFGRKCFILEFEEGQLFEILSMNTFIEIPPLPQAY